MTARIIDEQQKHKDVKHRYISYIEELHHEP